jgi:NADH-quinone oxidoreductase subunit F
MSDSKNKTPRLIVGLGTCGIAAGAENIHRMFLAKVASNPDLGLDISITGCNGMCHREPLVEYMDSSGNSFTYGDLTEKKAELIFEKHIKGGTPIDGMLLKSSDPESAAGTFLKKQNRIVLRNCGVINPEKIEEYIALGGYDGLKKAINLGSDAIIKEVTDSGLRGRGGAGFLTGLKWKFAKLLRTI